MPMLDRLWNFLSRHLVSILLGALTVILLCCACLLGLDPSAKYDAQPVTVGEAPAVYYPGQEDAPYAFLIAGNRKDTASKALLSCILPSGCPVLVTSHEEAAGEIGRSVLEAQTAALSQKSGLPQEKIILIGYHYGASSLLDEMVYGSQAYQAMVILSPVVGSSAMDEAIIVNGNYQNKSDWINSLSPSMVRQPVLLLTSNMDDISTPYMVTLIYNKLSGSELIHMGGVYHASRGQVNLSVVDGGIHPNIPYNSTVLQDVVTYLNSQTTLELSTVGWVWLLRGLRFLMLAALLVSMWVVQILARRHSSEISYGIAPSQEEGGPFPGRLLLSQGVGWLPGLLVLGGLCALLGRVLTLDVAVLYSLSLLALFAGKALVMLLTARRAPVRFFRPLRLHPGRLLLSLGYTAACGAVLLVIPFSGFTFRWPQPRALLLALGLALAAFPWFWGFLVQEELLRRKHTPGIWFSCVYLLDFLPLGAFVILYGVFTGYTGLLLALYLLLFTAGGCLLANGVRTISGSLVVGAALPSLLFQFLALLFTQIPSLM